jgi:programmed cell death protein 5
MEEGEDEQYNKKLRKRVTEALRAAKLEEQKKEIMKQFLEPKAYERVMNIRASNYELYSNIVNVVVSLAQGNRINSKINESQLKSILAKLTNRREPTIEFKHK